MAEETLWRLRVRYVETGRLKYLSHLELLRALERSIRRSGIPFAITQGFTPRIKAAYCPALPVSVASVDEWFDLWVREDRPAEEYLALLRDASPVDLMPQEAAYVGMRSPSLSAALTIATWSVEVAPQQGRCRAACGAGCPGLEEGQLEEACRRVVEAGSIEYVRNRKPKTVSLEGRIAVPPRVERGASDGPCTATMTFTTRSDDAGALRPDVFLAAVRKQLTETSGTSALHDAVETPLGVVFCPCIRMSVTRTAQYLEGEDGTWVRPI